MKRKLPKGEETLPIVEMNGVMLRYDEFSTAYPGARPAVLGKASQNLLVERIRMRVVQGREMSIYRMTADGEKELSPDEQIVLAIAGDEEILAAEQKLLSHELRILEDEDGDS